MIVFVVSKIDHDVSCQSQVFKLNIELSVPEHEISVFPRTTCLTYVKRSGDSIFRILPAHSTGAWTISKSSCLQFNEGIDFSVTIQLYSPIFKLLIMLGLTGSSEWYWFKISSGNSFRIARIWVDNLLCIFLEAKAQTLYSFSIFLGSADV